MLKLTLLLTVTYTDIGTTAETDTAIDIDSETGTD